MKDKIENLRTKYEGFKRGKESALAVRDEAQSVLEEAVKRGNPKIVVEVEDMIIDLEFSVEENKCKCHRKSPIC